MAAATNDYVDHFTVENFANPVLILGFKFPLLSKSNFRNHQKNKYQKNWSEFKHFNTLVTLSLKQYVPDNWVIPSGDTPVNKRPVVVCSIWAKTLLDAANLSKSAVDCTEGVLTFNDAEVQFISQISQRSNSDQRFILGFSQLPAGATLQTGQTELEELTKAVVDSAQSWAG